MPDWPFPDTTLPDEEYREDVSDPVNHCAPIAGTGHYILVRRSGAPIDFSCRIRGERSLLWQVQLPDNDDRVFPPAPGEPEFPPYAIASGAERVSLHGADLPWSPAPYRADLSITVDSGSREVVVRWPLVVLPFADELVPVELP